MKKIGVIGCGFVVKTGHLTAIRDTEGLEVTHIYDINEESVAELQKLFNIRHACKTPEELLDSDIDGVLIATPVGIHLHYIKLAAKYRKPILCEKPLAMTVEEISEAIKIAKDHDVPLYSGFNYRYSEVSKKIKEMIDNRAIGEVRAMRLVYLWNLHGKIFNPETGEFVDSAMRRGRMAEGGPLVDCGLHQIDLIRWWLQEEFVWMQSSGIWVEKNKYPDHIHADFRTQRGVHAQVEVSFSYNATSSEPFSRFLYEVIGTNGVIMYNRERQIFEVRNSKETKAFEWGPEKNFTGLHEEFRKTLEGDPTASMPTAYDALIATFVAKRATERAVLEYENFLDAHTRQIENNIMSKLSDHLTYSYL